MAAGSWKIAFADFSIAMMAVFLVLWLIAVSSVNVQTRQTEEAAPAVAGSKAGHFVGDRNAATQGVKRKGRKERKDTRKERASQKSRADAAAAGLAAQLSATGGKGTGKGRPQKVALPHAVRLCIVNQDEGPVFPPGRSTMAPFYEDLLISLAPRLAHLGKRLIITGHSDGPPQGAPESEDNWRLSGERANTARAILTYAGVPDKQILQISGLAATQPLISETDDDFNRRIEILVVANKSVRHLGKQQTGEQGEAPLTQEQRSQVTAQAQANRYPTQDKAEADG